MRSPSFAVLYTAKCSMKSSGPPISPCKYRLYSVNWIVWAITWLGLLINMSLIVVLLIFHQSDGYVSHQPSPHNIRRDRKSTRLNSSHVRISYAVFCLKKKKKNKKEYK